MSAISACFDNCGSVHGFCNESARVCSCTYPWVNLGDFVPEPNLVCDINFEVSKGLWAVEIAVQGLYIILLLVSLARIRRGTKAREQVELLVLCNLILGNALHLAVGALQVTATSPGERSIGVDVVTTLMYVLGEVSLMSHSTFLPFVQSGTSVLPYALSSSGVMRHHPRKVMALYGFFLALIIVSMILIFVMPFYPSLSASLIPSSLSMIFVLTLGTSVFVLGLIRNLLSKLRQLVTSSQGRELSATAKSGLEQTEQVAKSTKMLAYIALFLYSPQFLVLAASPAFAWRAAWAWLPLKRIVVCIFDLRHIYLSLSTSFSYKRTSSHSFDDGAKNDKDASALLSPTSLKSTGPSTAFRPKRRVKELTIVEEERTVDMRTEVGTYSNY